MNDELNVRRRAITLRLAGWDGLVAAAAERPRRRAAPPLLGATILQEPLVP